MNPGIIGPSHETHEPFTYYCRLLISFADSLYPDQARQNVGTDLDPNCSTLSDVFFLGALRDNYSTFIEQLGFFRF